MIIAFACSFDYEFTTDTTSPRALAALGLVDCRFNHDQYVKDRKVALQMRRDVLLVSSAWNEMGKDHTYKTIVLTDSSRRYIPELIARFLANPRLAEGVRRLELNFSVNRFSVELIGAGVRGLLKHCPKVEIVDDFVRREASKRSVSPIQVAMQAAGEIPFAVTLGNRHCKTIEQARFSRESTAAFNIKWFVELMKRLNEIKILCLDDFPGWKDLPIARTNTGAVNGNDSSDSSTPSRRHPYRPHINNDEDSVDIADSEYSLEYNSEADDEEERELEPLKFEYLHTLNMSRIKDTSSVPLANAFTKYIGSWEMPNLEQLAVSIYNLECIPSTLLRKYSDQLSTLCLHDFSISSPPAAENDAVAANPTGRQTQRRTTEDRKFILPRVTSVMVVPRHVSPDWIDTFSCPLVERYIMSCFSYSPTPHNATDYGVKPPKSTWSAHWRKSHTHLQLCLDSKARWPELAEVWVMDCEFLDAKDFPDDVKAFWEDWEARLTSVRVSLVGGKRGIKKRDGRVSAPTWSEARDIWEPGWRPARAKEREEQIQKVDRKENGATAGVPAAVHAARGQVRNEATQEASTPVPPTETNRVLSHSNGATDAPRTQPLQ